MPVNILNLPDLHVTDFKETETDYHVRAQPLVISRLCPHCGCSNDTIKHAQKTLFIRDMPSHGKIVAIHLDVPRLLCKPCQQTFTAVVPEIDTTRQMTGRLVRWIGRQSLEYTYAEVAKQAGVDEKTVRNVFDEYVTELEQQYRRETPVWLGIDEIKLGRFRAVFTNLKEHALIDMLPDRYGSNDAGREGALFGALIFSTLKRLLPGRQNGNMKCRVVPSAELQWCAATFRSFGQADPDVIMKRVLIRAAGMSAIVTFNYHSLPKANTQD